MAKRRNVGICAMCGKTRKLSLEHVPPKGCFPKPRPTPLPIYTCKACNVESSVEDEHLKAFIGATATQYSPKGRGLQNDFFRTISHNKKLLRKILSGEFSETVVDENGNKKPGVIGLK